MTIVRQTIFVVQDMADDPQDGKLVYETENTHIVENRSLGREAAVNDSRHSDVPSLDIFLIDSY